MLSASLTTDDEAWPLAEGCTLAWLRPLPEGSPAEEIDLHLIGDLALPALVRTRLRDSLYHRVTWGSAYPVDRGLAVRVGTLCGRTILVGTANVDPSNADPFSAELANGLHDVLARSTQFADFVPRLCSSCWPPIAAGKRILGHVCETRLGDTGHEVVVRNLQNGVTTWWAWNVVGDAGADAFELVIHDVRVSGEADLSEFRFALQIAASPSALRLLRQIASSLNRLPVEQRESAMFGSVRFLKAGVVRFDTGRNEVRRNAKERRDNLLRTVADAYNAAPVGSKSRNVREAVGTRDGIKQYSKGYERKWIMDARADGLITEPAKPRGPGRKRQT